MQEMTPEEYVERLLEITDAFSEEADEILDMLVEIGEPAIQPLIENFLGSDDVYYGELEVDSVIPQFRKNQVVIIRHYK